MRVLPTPLHLLTLCSFLLCAQITPAQESSGARPAIETVIVTASRREQPINEIARTVVVLEQEVIAEELAKTSNIANLLGARIPGFGAPTHIDQLRTQTLRGREPLYLIDGIPLAFNGGAGFLQGPLVKFDSGTVGRVEVLYGPTSIYGAGATGGVIQFFSVQPPRDKAIELNLRQSFVFYPGADDPLDSDSLSWRSALRAAGTIDRFDYVVSYSHDAQNGVYDGNGDLANPVYYGYTDDDSYFAKLGFEPDEMQRIELLASFVDREFDDTNFETVFTDDGFAIAEEADEDVRFRYVGNSQPKDEKTFFSLSYSHDDLWGNQLKAQLYTREDDIREPLVDLVIGIPPFPDNYQAVKNDESTGVRFQLSRSFMDRLTLVIGADYEEQEREADAFVYDIGTAFNRTRVVDTPIRSGLFIYPFELDTLGVFLQAELEVSERLRVSGGIRHEDAEFEIGSGVRLFDSLQADRPGGSGEDNGYAYNIGFTYDALPALTVYANYAEGYTLPSLSQVSTIVPPDQPLESDEAIEPQIVDNYELGFRGAVGALAYSVAGYFSESDFGENFIYDPATGLGQYNRAPEETYGFEVVGDWQATERLSLTATYSWVEGEFDPDDSGDFVSQSGLDIPPWKATLNGRYEFSDRFSINFQALVVGDRDEAFNDGVDLWEVEGYEVFDVGLDWRVGSGLFSAQVTNVLDETYLAPSSQSYTNSLPFRPRVAGAPGRAVSLVYDVSF